MKVQRVAFGPQPHNRLACHCSAIHAVLALPEKLHTWNFSFRALYYFEVTAACH